MKRADSQSRGIKALSPTLQTHVNINLLQSLKIKSLLVRLELLLVFPKSLLIFPI